MSDRDDLEIILRAHFPLLTVSTYEEIRTVKLFKVIAPRLRLPLSRWTVTDGLDPIVGDATFNPSELRLVGEVPVDTHSRSTTDPEYALRVIRNAKQPGIILLLDFHPFLREPVHVRLIKEIAQDHDARRQKLIFVSHELALPAELARYSASFNLRLPNSNQIGRIITEESAVWAAQHIGENVRVDRQAVSALLHNLTGFTDTDARRLVRNAIADDGAITAEDVPEIVAAKRSLVDQQGLLSFEYDTAHLSDVGGFENLKRWLRRRQSQFTAQTGDDADRPKGVMLLGVQGGGKSLAAKAVAGIWKVPLLRLDFGVLYNKFFGETERNMREALQTAEVMAPCVLWCDEIEKGISTGDYDSGTSKRLLGTLLTWMAENDQRVFIVATANDVTALPPELIRKGRLDEVFFIDLPSAVVRGEIFAIHLSKRQLDPKRFDLEQLAAASEGFTGAEIEQAIVAARYAAGARDTTATTGLILDELAGTKPLSVVRAEDIERLRIWAKGRTVSAD
jgi:AAA+ superfamily predicted ATPase